MEFFSNMLERRYAPVVSLRAWCNGRTGSLKGSTRRVASWEKPEQNYNKDGCHPAALLITIDLTIALQIRAVVFI